MAYKRYIDAVGLAEVIENLDIRVAGKPARWNDAKYSVLREISQAPDAGVEEVKHGYWFIIEYDSFHCSICGKDVPSGADSTKQAKEYLQKGLVYPYCPRCGAKMDGRK